MGAFSKLVLTDGSAPTGRGSFGWVISDDNGNILAQYKGAVFGGRITLYCSEGYGILSVLRFLLRMRQVHRKEGQPEVQSELLDLLRERIIQSQQSKDEEHGEGIMREETLCSHPLVCDNKSMVNKVNEIVKYDKIYPNVTMESEWDILAEIRTTMRELASSSPSLSHIKSHQDRKKPFEELPLQAQLNFRADWLAEAYLQENPDVDHSRAPVLPSSGCQLHLASGTATHNIKKALKHARTAPPFDCQAVRGQCMEHGGI
jgi:hypothetical protein